MWVWSRGSAYTQGMQAQLGAMMKKLLATEETTVKLQGHTNAQVQSSPVQKYIASPPEIVGVPVTDPHARADALTQRTTACVQLAKLQDMHEAGLQSLHAVSARRLQVGQATSQCQCMLIPYRLDQPWPITIHPCSVHRYRQASSVQILA